MSVDNFWEKMSISMAFWLKSMTWPVLIHTYPAKEADISIG
jgi:hypothetical protein